MSRVAWADMFPQIPEPRHSPLGPGTWEATVRVEPSRADPSAVNAGFDFEQSGWMLGCVCAIDDLASGLGDLLDLAEVTPADLHARPQEAVDRLDGATVVFDLERVGLWRTRRCWCRRSQGRLRGWRRRCRFRMRFLELFEVGP